MRERTLEGLAVSPGVAAGCAVVLGLPDTAPTEEVPVARRGAEALLATGAHLHVNLLGLEPDDDRPDEAVLRLALDCGGNHQRRARSRDRQGPLAAREPRP